jgi:hypothetical protein
MCQLVKVSTHLGTPIQHLFTDDEGLEGIYTMGNKAKNLSEEQVSQIAERVGAQLKQKQVSATDGANRPGRMSAYLVGGASGLVLALAAPFLRPVMRSAVKGGILVGRYARQVGSGMKEEFEDIVAEAEADLEKEKGEIKEEG